MIGTSLGSTKVKMWSKKHGVPIRTLSQAIGDKGGQLYRWTCGDRQTLPLKLKVKISIETGIPLNSLLDRQQRQMAREIVKLMARDAAA
jgi:hypothetical protein